MDKIQALKKLKDLEDETAKLRKIIEQPDDLFTGINGYSDIYKKLNEKDVDKEYAHFNDKVKSFMKLKQIERYFNGDWIPKFNGSQYNHYPYFTKGSSGLLNFYNSNYNNSNCFGQVAYFKDEKTSTFVGKTFIQIYRDLYN